METKEVVEDIVIVGAGIAGLSTSLGLHRLGIRSLVLESSDSLRITGFALSIWENAWKALDAVGVGDFLRQQHPQLNRVVTTSLVTGQQTSVMSFTETGNQQRDREIRCVKRKLLLEALANELPSGTIRYLSKVVALEESGFYKILHLADGTTIKTKGDIQSGAVQKFRAITDKELEDNPAKLKEYVLNKLEKMPSDIRYYIEKTELDVILLVPLRYRHPWELMFGNISKGNVCVGGDALHPMTPDLGQGGCCALEDGVVLARFLGEAFSKHIKEKDEEDDQFKRIEESLKKYAKERRWRSIDVIATAYMVGSIQQAESKLVTFLRDNILAAFLASQYLKKSGYDCGKLNSS
ncbi:Monooxygenase 3 [Glycine max]|nr:Monooxygenase 3 [Glycine max]